MQTETGFLDRIFHLSANGTTARTEMLAGITTFMTMAYILAVNPAILSVTGMDKGAVLTATALASCLGTVFMAAFANYPFALAPGMGLNAFFAFTVVLQMGYSWQMALAAVFIEGIIFIILSLTNVREAIFNAIPMTLKKAVSAGIGLFIALSPMLGFMGTVVGMIAAFDAIQAAGDISPTLVAGGIKVALLTTLMGLIAAVVLQLFYNYIVSKIDSLVNDMEDSSITLMDILTAYNKK